MLELYKNYFVKLCVWQTSLMPTNLWILLSYLGIQKMVLLSLRAGKKCFMASCDRWIWVGVMGVTSMLEQKTAPLRFPILCFPVGSKCGSHALKYQNLKTQAAWVFGPCVEESSYGDSPDLHWICVNRKETLCANPRRFLQAFYYPYVTSINSAYPD